MILKNTEWLLTDPYTGTINEAFDAYIFIFGRSFNPKIRYFIPSGD